MDGSAGTRPPLGQQPAAAAPPRQAKSYRELFGRCWKLIAVSVVLHMHRDIDLQLFQPFFFSRVRCCGFDGGVVRFPLSFRATFSLFFPLSSSLILGERRILAVRCFPT